MAINYKKISRYYDIIDVVYFTAKGINPRRALLDAIPHLSGTCVLDLCCGTMANSILLAKEHKDIAITGLDISAEMLETAETKIRENGIETITLVQQDATKTSFADGSFDAVIISLILHEMEADLARRVLAEARRLVKDSGKVLVLEWEKPKNLWQRLLFFPVSLIEPKPFKTFYTLDKAPYFTANGFRVAREHACDYSRLFELEKT